MAKSIRWKYLETILKTLLQGLQGRQEVDPGPVLHPFNARVPVVLVFWSIRL